MSTNQKKTIETKEMKVRVYCQAYYDTTITIPAHLTENEAFDYAEKHLNEIPVTELNYIPDSDELDKEDIALGNTYLIE